MKPYLLRRKADGLCAHCGRPVEPGRAGKARCQACSDRETAARHDKYINRATHGLCVKCGREADGYSYCPACREYYRNIFRQRRQKACQ